MLQCQNSHQITCRSFNTHLPIIQRHVYFFQVIGFTSTLNFLQVIGFTSTLSGGFGLTRVWILWIETPRSCGWFLMLVGLTERCKERESEWESCSKWDPCCCFEIPCIPVLLIVSRLNYSLNCILFPDHSHKIVFVVVSTLRYPLHFCPCCCFKIELFPKFAFFYIYRRLSFLLLFQP